MSVHAENMGALQLTRYSEASKSMLSMCGLVDEGIEEVLRLGRARGPDGDGTEHTVSSYHIRHRRPRVGGCVVALHTGSIYISPSCIQATV
jgi:hypothetical protein